MALGSCEPNDLAKEVLEGLRTLGMQSEGEQQKGEFKTPIFMANILVFSLSLKKRMAFKGLSRGLFKFADWNKDDA